MDIWKSKVLPKIKLVFAKSAGKKAAAAAELVKSFDESKVSRRRVLSLSALRRHHFGHPPTRGGWMMTLFVAVVWAWAGGDQWPVRGEEGGSPA